MRGLLSLVLVLTLLPPAVAREGERPLLVTVQPFSHLAVHPRLGVPATVVPLDDTWVSAEIAGRLVAVEGEVGRAADRGQRLARIDCREPRSLEAQAVAALDAARAGQALAEREWRRAQTLKRDRNISEELYSRRQAEWQQAIAELERAEAALEAARVRVSRCQVTAPFAGVVVERSAQTGMWVAPGTRLFRLVGVQRLEVEAGLDLREMESLRHARRRGFEGGGRDVALGEFRLVPMVRPESREIEVRFPLRGELLPGTAGTLWWQSATAHLPAELLSVREGRAGVFVLEGDRVRWVVLPGATEGSPAPAPMLKPQTLIVVDGRHGLSDGQPVRVGESSPRRP